jgi:hypothetical protein
LGEEFIDMKWITEHLKGLFSFLTIATAFGCIYKDHFWNMIRKYKQKNSIVVANYKPDVAIGIFEESLHIDFTTNTKR